jgi:hypothetical protein
MWNISFCDVTFEAVLKHICCTLSKAETISLFEDPRSVYSWHPFIAFWLNDPLQLQDVSVCTDLCGRIVREGHANCWEICGKFGSALVDSDADTGRLPGLRSNLLSFAMAHCPPDRIRGFLRDRYGSMFSWGSHLFFLFKLLRLLAPWVF